MKPKDYVRQYHKESFYQQLLAGIHRCLPARGLPLQVDNGSRLPMMSWSPLLWRFHQQCRYPPP